MESQVEGSQEKQAEAAPEQPAVQQQVEEQQMEEEQHTEDMLLDNPSGPQRSGSQLVTEGEHLHTGRCIL
jgi:hypothetical protein